MTQQCLSTVKSTAQTDLFSVSKWPCLFTEQRNTAGTASGGLFALQCPDLQNYSHVRAHKQPTLDAAAVSEGVASASADWIRFHSTGSVPKLTISAAQVPC